MVAMFPGIHVPADALLQRAALAEFDFCWVVPAPAPVTTKSGGFQYAELRKHRLQEPRSRLHLPQFAAGTRSYTDDHGSTCSRFGSHRNAAFEMDSG